MALGGASRVSTPLRHHAEPYTLALMANNSATRPASPDATHERGGKRDEMSGDEGRSMECSCLLKVLGGDTRKNDLVNRVLRFKKSAKISLQVSGNEKRIYIKWIFGTHFLG